MYFPEISSSTDDSIDIVYGWLNGSDPIWRNAFEYAYKKHKISMRKKNFNMRFIEGDELRYSLRSVEMYAINLIRYIFIIVPNNYSQIPYWLNTKHPKIRIISQREIFNQPVPKEYQNDTNSIFIFNSNSIDNSITNIPNLSNKYIYMNDDFFFGNHVNKSDFFDEKDRPKLFVNFHDFSNAEKEYKMLSVSAKNDFSGGKFNAVLQRTVLLVKQKLHSYLNLDFYHVQFPYTKRLFKEAVSIFGEEINQTISSPFRNVTDVLNGALTLQFGLYKNRIVPIQYNTNVCQFAMISSLASLKTLQKISIVRPKFFCINCDNTDLVPQSKAFLASYFPNKSSFEL